MEGLEELLDELGLGDEWEASSFGDTLICKHGHELELDNDGHGDCGCRSPLRALGLI